MKISNPAKIIDHTNIKTNALQRDIKKLCKEAKSYGFRSVCVNPEWVAFAKQQGVNVSVLIDAPMGLSPHSRRVEMCKKAKKAGADELDIVLNVIDIKYERYDEVLNDLKEICKILPTKVIIGSGYLTNKEIEKASEIVKKAGCFCVKTATEKDPLEHIELEEKARHLQIMKDAAPGLKIKASGKIKSLRDLKKMVEAGADIIGTSSGVQIMKSFKRRK